MVALWQRFYDVLAQDACIVSIVDPLTGDSSGGIRRGLQPEKNKFKNCVCYRELTPTPSHGMQDGRRVPNPIYDVPMQTICWVIEGQGDEPADVKCATLGWCVVQAVEGCDFNANWCNDKTLLVYRHVLDGFQSPVYYDEGMKSWRRDIRFRFTVATCSYVQPLAHCDL